MMEKGARTLTDCLDGHSRSAMDMFLVLMHRHGFITDSDLDLYSRELREHVVTAAGRS